MISWLAWFFTSPHIYTLCHVTFKFLPQKERNLSASCFRVKPSDRLCPKHWSEGSSVWATSDPGPEEVCRLLLAVLDRAHHNEENTSCLTHWSKEDEKWWGKASAPDHRCTVRGRAVQPCAARIGHLQPTCGCINSNKWLVLSNWISGCFVVCNSKTIQW